MSPIISDLLSQETVFLQFSHKLLSFIPLTPGTTVAALSPPAVSESWLKLRTPTLSVLPCCGAAFTVLRMLSTHTGSSGPHFMCIDAQRMTLQNSTGRETDENVEEKRDRPIDQTYRQTETESSKGKEGTFSQELMTQNGFEQEADAQILEGWILHVLMFQCIYGDENCLLTLWCRKKHRHGSEAGLHS